MKQFICGNKSKQTFSQMNVLTQLGIGMTVEAHKSKTSLLDILHSSDTHIPSTADVSHQDRDKDRLVVFTDGSCLGNGSKYAKAGYAVVWPYHRTLDVSKRLIGLDQTNNRAEFSALIEAQTIADTLDPSRQKPLYVYTDSQLLINSITKWLPDWKKNNWKKADKKPVLNQDLLKKIDENPRPLLFTHVRAHTGKKDWESIYNDEADRLAREVIMK